MSSFTFYDTTIKQLIQGEQAFIAILKKAATHDNAASFPQARLTEDMLPLTSQIQIASDMAKKLVRDVYGVEVGAWEDKESTMEELIARCEKTLALLQGVKPGSAPEGKTPETQITTKFGPKMATVSVQDCVFGLVLPNFYFHLNMTYAILRANGVPLGKMDYLKPFLPFM